MRSFDIVVEAIGMEATLNLLQRCGGMIFYIPKLDHKKIITFKTLEQLKNSSKDEKIKVLMNKFKVNERTARRQFNEYIKLKKKLFG